MSGPRPSFTPAAVKRLRRELNAWYSRERRDLPWRRTRDPYSILVSEFMLQQTQVATVLPHYETFLRRFPTLESLARASEEEVRAAWSGLGYYRRARNLHAAVRMLAARDGGSLPARVELLRELPGVGPYTAAALASIVHGVPAAVVDGNVIRVLTRLVADPRSVTRAETRRDLDRLAGALLDPESPGDWNQAIMELGARVCLPNRPRCGECPFRGACAARALGTPEQFPHKPPARAAVAVDRAVAVFERRGAVLLVLRRDPSLLDGTWEFPGLDVPGARSIRGKLADHLETWLGRPVTVGAELARVRHAITHRRITLRAYASRTDPLPRARTGARHWVLFGEAGELPRSSMTVKVMKALAELRKNRS